MHDIGDLVQALIRGVGVLALLTLAHGFVFRTLSAMMSRGVAVGIVFGLGAIATMSDPFVLRPGVILDARGIILVLAAPFGGPVAAMISGGIAGVFRFWLGGAGAPLGVVVILTAAATGMVMRPVLDKRGGGYDLGALLLLAAAGSAQSMLLLLLPFFAPVDPWPMLLPHVITNCLGILVLGHFLSAEGRRRHAHRLAESQAATDPLTGLPNRRMFERSASIACVRPGPASLLLIDIDHFKQVNDRWGHDVGDRVLCQVADAIRSSIRDSDVVARYGGEEMIVLLPSTDLDTAEAIAERIRSTIEHEVFHISRTIGDVTVSIGVAVTSNGTGYEAAFVAADRALYQAKGNGRNRVEVDRSDERERLGGSVSSPSPRRGPVTGRRAPPASPS
ncbi:MAG: diguanylate cyclase [Fulvimarina manganoxydans]|uniref:GGDEF domain-containing protein n=1 Tax=Fulvimarina manganoxydans TaxID=937218 RepID=UPI0023521DC7|nr:diguanylate cyclase [Fulvimarina manganoxydans]MCK5931051.1 diguanylate cyclase [Fulvimarina manganoxydans]